MKEKSTPKNSMIKSQPDEGPEGKGCTANVVLMKNNNLYVANAGDSRTVLAIKNLAIDLSIDHKPELEKESQRIAKAGGKVTNGRIEGNLNLSRAMGDLKYKNNKDLKPEEQMITVYPDIVKQPISKNMDFLILGCDGVYDKMKSKEIVDFFYMQFKENPKAKISESIEKFMDKNISPDPSMDEGSGCDNMTCIVIKFNNQQ